jgi:NAD(P)-dependent dehydrogenase (short-subunit alcohol dehydrogenase family)
MTLHTLYHADAFRGRAIGVTGAAHGIGESIVKLLTQLGATVAAIDHDQKNLNRVADDLKQSAAAPIFVCCDVRDEAQMTRAISALGQRLGKIDGWVNNAMYARRGMIATQPEPQMNAAWDVNVLAPWKCMRALVEPMRQSGGSIVNISSIHAHETEPGAAAYASTKAALEGLTRAAAVELAPHRIRVNAIVPGYILSYAGTDSHHPDPKVAAEEQALRRRIEELEGAQQPWPTNGLPSDVADLAAFLLSDASRFITGASIAIDGGSRADIRRTSDHLAGTQAELESCRTKLRNLGLNPDVTY